MGVGQRTVKCRAERRSLSNKLNTIHIKSTIHIGNHKDFELLITQSLSEHLHHFSTSFVGCLNSPWQAPLFICFRENDKHFSGDTRMIVHARFVGFSADTHNTPTPTATVSNWHPHKLDICHKAARQLGISRRKRHCQCSKYKFKSHRKACGHHKTV
jgi:hypothetical protein